MNIISSLLYAISANADNLVVGLSYGINKIKINQLSNFIIALITVAGTFLSMSLSKVVLKLIPINLSNIIGGLILILIGARTIIRPLLKKSNPDSILDHPEIADKDKSQDISAKEAVPLAVALSINNIGLGIGASITGLNIAITLLLTLIISLFMIRIGHFLGINYISKVIGKKTEIVSGLLIMILGVIEILL